MLPNPNSKVIALLTYASKLQTLFTHLQAFNQHVEYLKAHLGFRKSEDCITIATLKLKLATYCLVKTSTLSTSESKSPRDNVLDYKI
jgi:hypothetical protein